MVELGTCFINFECLRFNTENNLLCYLCKLELYGET